MISKNRVKQIHALARKKGRQTDGLFVAEGPKLVKELQNSFDMEALFDDLTVDELHKASLQQSPQGPIALFRIPTWALPTPATDTLYLALDTVQDPGNLGTIVRVADWFGIEDIVCSEDSADIFAPKAVQATMGALSRVRVHYTDLAQWLDHAKNKGIPVYGTFLDGDNLYEKKLTPGGIIVMGNEGNGISQTAERLVSERLFVPPYPAGRQTSESLNVAMATGIICAEFRRRHAK
jgi:TrmH family RNA methyltransferase